MSAPRASKKGTTVWHQWDIRIPIQTLCNFNYLSGLLVCFSLSDLHVNCLPRCVSFL